MTANGPDTPVVGRTLCRPPKLQPTFGCRAWSGTSTCDHVHPHGPIPRGSVMCCMACHKSGVDHLKVLQITAADMPRPEPKPAPEEPKPREDGKRDLKQFRRKWKPSDDAGVRVS